MQQEPQTIDYGRRADEIVMDFRKVSKTFGKGAFQTQALKEISFEVRKGCITGLIGPDASGKTTLTRLACGLLVPDSGSITVLGKNAVTESLSVQSSVGYMPQRFGLYEDLTTLENLTLYADLQGLSPSERKERYAELMQMTGLADFMQRLAGRLSGGMKQKLGLACALLRYPDLLILDEPTVGVDPLSRRELWRIINRLVRQDQVTVLISTSYLDEAEKCDEVVMLHEGRMLGRGSPTDFRQQANGRTYTLSIGNLNRRTAYENVVAAPSVLDAVIQKDVIRIVSRTEAPPDVREFIPELAPSSLRPVPPRFEDSFITILHDRETAMPDSSQNGIQVHKTNGRDEGSEPVIRVQDLTRRFGSFYAVDGVSFEVYPGEIFGLLGANGAGKSTTFRMLCGLLPVSSGSLQVAGVDLRHAAAAARNRIGYMSQKFSLYGDLSIRQNLNFFSSAYGLSGRRRRERIQWAIDQFGLAVMGEVNSSMIPLGYKQRLAMACALMHSPEILFLDEPTSGIDPLARRQFWNRINALADHGVTIMVTTHFMEEAEYCDRLAIMSSGKILTLGTPGQIRHAARTEANPEPTVEEAFIHLIEQEESERKAS